MNYYVYIYKNLNNDIVYIGQTINPWNRYLQHLQENKEFKSVSTVGVVELSSKREMDLYEEMMIRKYRPALNISFVDNSSFKLDFMEEETKWYSILEFRKRYSLSTLRPDSRDWLDFLNSIRNRILTESRFNILSVHDCFLEPFIDILCNKTKIEGDLVFIGDFGLFSGSFNYHWEKSTEPYEYYRTFMHEGWSCYPLITLNNKFVFSRSEVTEKDSILPNPQDRSLQEFNRERYDGYFQVPEYILKDFFQST